MVIFSSSLKCFYNWKRPESWVVPFKKPAMEKWKLGLLSNCACLLVNTFLLFHPICKQGFGGTEAARGTTVMRSSYKACQDFSILCRWSFSLVFSELERNLTLQSKTLTLLCLWQWLEFSQVLKKHIFMIWIPILAQLSLKVREWISWLLPQHRCSSQRVSMAATKLETSGLGPK